jgi:hypothetical protein
MRMPADLSMEKIDMRLVYWFVFGPKSDMFLRLSQTLALCRNVKNRLGRECRLRGISHYLVSCRVTQTYDAGMIQCCQALVSCRVTQTYDSGMIQCCQALISCRVSRPMTQVGFRVARLWYHDESPRHMIQVWFSVARLWYHDEPTRPMIQVWFSLLPGYGIMPRHAHL